MEGMNMATPLIPQEIYLLERYTSLAYFEVVRDAWELVVKAAEDALAAFMLNLPPDYRSRPLYDQPDRIWGEHILPRMRNTLTALHTGCIRLSHGDWEVLGGISVGQCQRAINSDYSTEWMPEPYQSIYDQQDRLTSGHSNISITALGHWNVGSLSTRYKEDNRGPLLAPPSWPIYRLNPAVQVRTGEPVPQNGIYLPDVDNSAPMAMIKGYEAWPANVGLDAHGHSASRPDATWTLVERIADTGGGSHEEDLLAWAEARRLMRRCEAGDPCPQDGYWHTHAMPPNTRARYFKKGDIMPKLDSFNASIWAFISTDPNDLNQF
jgi:hypothetical protein